MNSYWQSNCEYVDEGHHFSSTIGSSVLPHESLQTALDQADAGHGPDVPDMELIMVAGSNNGSGGIYAESVTYSGATNGVYIRRIGGGIQIGPNASGKSFQIGDELNKQVLMETDKTEFDKIEFDEHTILPGQTKPYCEIGKQEEN